MISCSTYAHTALVLPWVPLYLIHRHGAIHGDAEVARELPSTIAAPRD